MESYDPNITSRGCAQQAHHLLSDMMLTYCKIHLFPLKRTAPFSDPKENRQPSFTKKRQSMAGCHRKVQNWPCIDGAIHGALQDAPRISEIQIATGENTSYFCVSISLLAELPKNDVLSLAPVDEAHEIGGRPSAG